MKFSAYSAAIALAASSVLFLAGCGGGGDGSTTADPESKSNAAIKSSNAKNIGAHAYAVVDFLNQQISSSTIEVTDPTSGDLSKDRCSDPSLGGATRTVDPSTDTVTIKFTNCDDGVWIKSGTVTIQVSNDPGGARFQNQAWSGKLSMNFDVSFKLNATWAALMQMDSTSSEKGDLTIDYIQTAPNVGQFQATNTALQWRITSGTSLIERNISHLAYTGSTDASGANNFNVGFTLLGNLGSLGSVKYDVKTKTDFMRQASTKGLLNPTKGALMVTASDKSSLTLTAIDTSAVGLGVDWNGDNIIDKNIPTSWTELNTLTLLPL